jgi:SAM-dependent methyltransferase
MPLDEARDYFEFLARLGLTKHLGSMEATRELVGLCHIGPGQLVLDIGCGVGATPVFLAKELGCQVVGVDLLESMIEQSQERARMEGVGGQIALAVADALEARGWIELLEDAGLEGVVGSARPVNIPRESRGRFDRYGCRGIMRVLLRTLGVFLQDPASRAFLKDVTQSLPKDLLGEMGYGVYAGRRA